MAVSAIAPEDSKRAMAAALASFMCANRKGYSLDCPQAVVEQRSLLPYVPR